MKVKYIEPPKEISLQSIAHYVAQIASVVYDRDGVRNEIERFNQLMVEAYGSRPSSVLAFVPCAIEDIDEFMDYFEIGYKSRMFGYRSGSKKYKTNLRELLMWGLDIETCLDFIDFTNHHVVKCVAPYFIFGQLSRHQTMAMVSHSQRMAVSKNGYYYPPEYPKWIKDNDINIITQVGWDNRVRNSSPEKLENFIKKELGVKRKEIWARGSDMLENRSFCLGGYTDNEYQWDWLFRQRILDSHTQKETRQWVAQIQDTITDRKRR